MTVQDIRLLFDALKMGLEVFRLVRDEVGEFQAAKHAADRAQGMAAGRAAYLEGKRVGKNK